MLRQSVMRLVTLCISVGPQLQASRAATVSQSSHVRARVCSGGCGTAMSAVPLLASAGLVLAVTAWVSLSAAPGARLVAAWICQGASLRPRPGMSAMVEDLLLQCRDL